MDVPDYLDITRLRPLTTQYFKLLSQAGNIYVWLSCNCVTDYRRNWDGNSTVMRIKGVYVKLIHDRAVVRATTFDPPMLLNGQRPPDTGYGPLDQDDTIRVGDRGYGFWYPFYKSAPCLDLADLLRTKPLADLWLLMLAKHGGIDNYTKEWDALEFDPLIGLPYGAEMTTINRSDEQALINTVSAPGSDLWYEWDTPDMFPEWTPEQIGEYHSLMAAEEKEVWADFGPRGSGTDGVDIDEAIMVTGSLIVAGAAAMLGSFMWLHNRKKEFRGEKR